MHPCRCGNTFSFSANPELELYLSLCTRILSILYEKTRSEAAPPNAVMSFGHATAMAFTVHGIGTMVYVNAITGLTVRS